MSKFSKMDLIHFRKLRHRCNLHCLSCFDKFIFPVCIRYYSLKYTQFNESYASEKTSLINHHGWLRGVLRYTFVERWVTWTMLYVPVRRKYLSVFAGAEWMNELCWLRFNQKNKVNHRLHRWAQMSLSGLFCTTEGCPFRIADFRQYSVLKAHQKSCALNRKKKERKLSSTAAPSQASFDLTEKKRTECMR